MRGASDHQTCQVSSDALCHVIRESFWYVKVNRDIIWLGNNELIVPLSILRFWRKNLPGVLSQTVLCILFSVRLFALSIHSEKNTEKLVEKVNTLASEPTAFNSGWLLVRRPNGFVCTFKLLSYALQAVCEETLTFKEWSKINCCLGSVTTVESKQSGRLIWSPVHKNWHA